MIKGYQSNPNPCHSASGLISDAQPCGERLSEIQSVIRDLNEARSHAESAAAALISRLGPVLRLIPQPTRENPKDRDALYSTDLANAINNEVHGLRELCGYLNYASEALGL